jgi:hypothetical protein
MTVVEWLVQEIETGKIEIIVHSDKIHLIKCLPEFVEQAKEMEKEQIIKAHGLIAKLQEDGSHKLISGETYYNKTYKPSA